MLQMESSAHTAEAVTRQKISSAAAAANHWGNNTPLVKLLFLKSARNDSPI